MLACVGQIHDLRDIDSVFRRFRWFANRPGREEPDVTLAKGHGLARSQVAGCFQPVSHVHGAAENHGVVGIDSADIADLLHVHRQAVSPQVECNGASDFGR